MSYDRLTDDLLASAWKGLNAAAADLRLLVSATDDRALAQDARLLADAVEREVDTVLALRLRWHQRDA